MKTFTINIKQMTRVFSILTVIMLASVWVGLAQSQPVTGVVLDEHSNPIIGANIIVKGTTNGVTSGLNGDFRLNVEPNSVLVFSYVGYRSVEEQISAAKTSVQITLMPAAVDLDEVVVVGYNTQSRISVTGAVVSIKAEELESVATSNVATALTGHMPGVTVIQNSGFAGAGATSINVRGVSSDSASDPLILVDGFERDLDDLDMSEVETISVLKDASSTAVYGVRGANGVVIITTKSGQESDKIKFNFKAEGGFNMMGDLSDQMGSYTYALLWNEAVDNDAKIGISATKFTDEEVQKYKDGSSLAYPNIDMKDWAIDKFGYQHNYSLSMTGGSKKIKYYNAISYNYDQDPLTDYGQGYDASSWYSRINVRSNIEAKLTPTTTFSMNLGAQFTTNNQPNMNINQVFQGLIRTPPGLYAGVIDGHVVKVNTGHYAGTTSTNPIYQLYDTGYIKTRTNKWQSTFAIKQNLDFITKGLNFDLYYAYDGSSYSTVTFDPNTDMYYLTSEDPVIIESTSTSESTSSLSSSVRMNAINTKFRAMLNYNRTFNNAHSVSALVVFNLSDKSFHTDDYYDVPYRTLEVAAKATYNYKSRYFADINVGVSGSENFHPDYRYGVFPAFSAGWVVTNEEFFPSNNILSFLKLKGSYGVTGNDQGTSRFYYGGEYSYSTSGGYLFGGQSQGTGQGTSSESRMGNSELTWETNTQINVGINTQWFKNRLVMDVEYFNNYRKDILQTPQSVPGVTGITSSADINMKEISTRGYEIAVNWSDNIGKFNYSIGANMSYYENTIEEMGELEPDFEWQRQTGRGIDQYYGLDFVGFYSDAEIEQLQSVGGTPDLPTGYNTSASNLQAGDTKFRDLDGDGQITDNDMMYFDNMTVPPYSYAINYSLNYKNWGLSMMWQGVVGGYYEIEQWTRHPFYNGGATNTSIIHMDRWTPETADTAKYPRLTQAASSFRTGNYAESNLWLADSRYIRLKNVELSYKLSKEAATKLKLSSMRVYVSAYNLLTFTPLYFTDPETTGGGDTVAIPPSRIFNLGVQMSF